MIDRMRPRWTAPNRALSRADRFEAQKAPKLKLRFEPRVLFFGAAPARRLHTAGLEASALPDPGKILVRDAGAAEDSPKSPRYAEIEKALKEEMRALDSSEIGNSGIIATELGRSLLDRVIAATTQSVTRVALWASALGLAGFGAGFFVRTSAGAGADPFGFGTAYFLAGFAIAIMVGMIAVAASAVATRSYGKAENNLIALVRQTTQEFHDKLAPLRAAMQAKSTGDLPNAIKSATQARMTSVAALRFFDQTPVIGVEGEGHQCAILAERIQHAARTQLAARGRSLALAAAAGLGALAAAFILIRMAPATGAMAAIVEPVRNILGAEAARPGVVSLAAAIGALLGLPLLFGPMIALAGAAADPGAVLNANPTRRLVNDLRGRALAAAAERQRDVIERFADALDALEARARNLGGTAAGHSGSNGDTPSWRRAPEPPRFVATGFQAAPKTFLADAPKAPGSLMGLRNLFGGSKPKRGP